MRSTDVKVKQLRIFHAILKDRNLMDDKKNIVRHISNGRCESSSDLSFDELESWIASMNSESRKKALKQKDHPGQRMINHIIAMAREMGWVRRETKVLPGGGLKAESNYGDLDKWIDKYGYLKKPLNEYSYAELPTLVTAFKNVYNDYLKGKNKQ
jgi:hypothetical protein